MSRIARSRKEAKAKGQNFYFTGKPCKRGHISKRNLSGQCLVCLKGWKEEHREHLLAEKKRHYRENEETYKARVRRWGQKNPDKVRERSQRRRDENPELWKLYRHRYRKNNKQKLAERFKEYYQKHKGKYAAHTRKRQAALIQRTPVWLTDNQLQEMEQLYVEAKTRTKRTKIDHEVDHIVPLQGKNVCGLHVPWNLQITTRNENRSKSNRNAQNDQSS